MGHLQIRTSKEEDLHLKRGSLKTNVMIRACASDGTQLIRWNLLAVSGQEQLTNRVELGVFEHFLPSSLL